MAYVEAEPGKGVLMHNHDTNETFVVVEGTWKFEWEGENGDEHVILEEKDVVCFPTNVQRRFECLSARPGKSTGMIRSEAHTSELQSLMRNSYAVFCLKKKTK